MDPQDALYAAAPLVALTNPVAEVALFLTLIDGQPMAAQRASAMKAAAGVFVILATAVLIGHGVLHLLDISVSAFRAAGGLLVVTMGMEMVNGNEPMLQTATTGADDDRLWVPFVMPMLAGPGAIVTAVSLSLRESESHPIPIATLAATAIAALLVLAVLLLASLVAHRTSTRTRKIFTRFSGILLVAIGFQMGFTGIVEFFGISV